MRAIKCRNCGHLLIDFKNRKLIAVPHITYNFEIAETGFNLEINSEIELICPNCSRKIKLSKLLEVLKKKNRRDLIKILEVLLK